MAKYLIIDDVYDQWEGYQLYLEQHQEMQAGDVLASLQPHERNTFISGGYNEIKQHLREIIEADDLSLLITDVSLGGQDNAKDRATWVTTLLRELIDESEQVSRILRRRGMGLILLTQHHADILNRMIQDNQHFLMQYFPNSYYIASDEFNENIVKTVENIGNYFEEVNGRWFHVDKREEYFHGIGQMVRHFALIDDHQRVIALHNNQIISIKVYGNHSEITYFPDLANQQQTASFTTEDFQLGNDIYEEIGAINLTPYGRGELPTGIYPENEYFLQVRGRNPMTFINNSLDWNIRAHPNRGRILAIRGQEIHCTFSCLNEYFNV